MSNDPRLVERRPRALAAVRRQPWPAGATAGILLIAVACLGLSVTLYHLAGPRDVFADEASR
jgi:hypothetical protein